MPSEVLAIIIIAVVLATVVALVWLKKNAEPGSPIDEFCGGAEGLDEIHTLFDGIYARWNGVGPWQVPPDLPENEIAVWERERHYAKLGWLITDIIMRTWALIRRR